MFRVRNRCNIPVNPPNTVRMASLSLVLLTSQVWHRAMPSAGERHPLHLHPLRYSFKRIYILGRPNVLSSLSSGKARTTITQYLHGSLRIPHSRNRFFKSQSDSENRTFIITAQADNFGTGLGETETGCVSHLVNSGDRPGTPQAHFALTMPWRAL